MIIEEDGMIKYVLFVCFWNGVEEDAREGSNAGHLANMLLLLAINFGEFNSAFEFLGDKQMIRLSKASISLLIRRVSERTYECKALKDGSKHMTVTAPWRVKVNEPRLTIARTLLDNRLFECSQVHVLALAWQVVASPLHQRVDVSHPSVVHFITASAVRMRRIDAYIWIGGHVLFGA